MANLEELEGLIEEISTKDEKKFISITLKLMKALVHFFNKYPALQEEFLDYDEIYQISLKDINVHFWLQVSQGILSYQLGKNEKRSIVLKVSKDIFIKIVQGKLPGFDAYMKGYIVIEGQLRYALRFRNVINSLMRYLSYMINEK
jgi:hypothetical protein